MTHSRRLNPRNYPKKNNLPWATGIVCANDAGSPRFVRAGWGYAQALRRLTRCSIFGEAYGLHAFYSVLVAFFLTSLPKELELNFAAILLAGIYSLPGGGERPRKLA
jgi:hypothetical protein